jgi:hypothetical protein
MARLPTLRFVRTAPQSEPQKAQISPRDEIGELAWVSPDQPRLHLLNGSVNGAARQRCSVVVWRGYVKKQFCAADASGEIIATSPLFSARGRETARTASAKRALELLLADLAAGGWIEAAEGPRWHERELVRFG